MSFTKKNEWPIDSAALICYSFSLLRGPMQMIKSIKLEDAGGHTLQLTYSDGMIGLWDVAPELSDAWFER